MKGQNINKVDILKQLVMEAPIVYCLATASKSFPNAKAKDILEETSSSTNPNSIVEKYGLLQMYYNDMPIGFTKEELLADYYGHIEALCPFHLDVKRGSFKITPNKNLWWCFACSSNGSKHSHSNGRGGSQINFEMDFFNLDFVDAVYHLAYRLGIINDTEYLSKNIGDLTISSAEKFATTKKEVRKEVKADIHVIHNVYSAMQESCPLSDEDRRHLLEDRGLEECDLVNYFTYPDRRVNLPKRILNCIVEKYSLNKFGRLYKNLSREEKRIVDESKAIKELVEQFKYVPGFYYDKKKQKHDSVSYRGIGLLTRNESGKVIGVQIRRRETNKDSKGSRYVWLSSAFAQMEDDYIGGASSGSPGGVIYPKNRPLNNAALCITEGRFKAEQIAKDGNLTVYLSGVGTWKNIQKSVLNIKGGRNKVYIMFDADMMGNTSVHSQLRDLCKWLNEQNLYPYLIVWRKEFGKGYDDLKLNKPNNYKQYLRVINFFNFEDIYNRSVNYLLKKYGVNKITNIKRELAEGFSKELQSLIENNLNLPK